MRTRSQEANVGVIMKHDFQKSGNMARFVPVCEGCIMSTREHLRLAAPANHAFVDFFSLARSLVGNALRYAVIAQEPCKIDISITEGVREQLCTLTHRACVVSFFFSSLEYKVQQKELHRNKNPSSLPGIQNDIFLSCWA